MYLAGLIAALLYLVRDSPPVVTLAAVIPGLLWLALLAPVAARWGESLLAVAIAFLAGAVLAAAPASHVNQWIAERLDIGALAAVVVAPWIEELAKAAAIVWSLWAIPPARLNVRSGIVRGLAVGLGFTMFENTQYLLIAAIQGGIEHLPVAAYVRGVVGGLHHALFSACVGAGIGLAGEDRTASRMRWIVAAWVTAIVLHVVWNLIFAPTLAAQLCGMPEGATCLLTPRTTDLVLVAPSLTIGALAPGVFLLRWLVPKRGS